MNPSSLPPNWTVFPPLDLLGLGTPHVESLEHYLTRLSVACGTSPQKLAQCVWLATGRAPANGTGGQIQGPVHRFPDFVSQLEVMTGVDHLYCGTWKNLSECVRNARIGSTFRRWCPVCYLTRESSQSWEPFAWSISTILFCAWHNTRLVSSCNHCGSRQPSRSAAARRRVCVSCNQSLGFEPRRSPPTHTESWVNGVLLDLIGICADPRLPVVPRENVRELIRGLRYRKLPSGVHEALVHFRSRLRHRKKPGMLSIEAIVNLCALQHTNARTLLLAPLEAAAPPLFHDLVQVGVAPFSARARAMVVERAATVLGELARRPGRPLLPLSMALRALGARSNPEGTGYESVFARYELAFNKSNSIPNTRVVHRTIRSALSLVSERMSLGAPLEIRRLALHLSNSIGASLRIARWAIRGASRLLIVKQNVDAVFLSARNWQYEYGGNKRPKGV